MERLASQEKHQLTGILIALLLAGASFLIAIIAAYHQWSDSALDIVTVVITASWVTAFAIILRDLNK